MKKKKTFLSLYLSFIWKNKIIGEHKVSFDKNYNIFFEGNIC